MTAPAAVEAWATKAPDGSIIKVQIGRKPALYNQHKTLGYRCVRVTVQEIQE